MRLIFALPMPSAGLRAAIVELLAGLARALQQRGYSWYVFGAQAAIAYGRPRATADVDVAIALGDEKLEVLIAALQAEGFTLRFQPSEGFLASTRLLPFVHEPTSFPVDVLLTGRGLEEEFLARVRIVDLGGVEVPLVSPEDLVAMKILAGRRKDLDDVRAVLRALEGKLDLARSRDVLAALEVALDDHRLLARLERLLRQTTRPNR
jgi:predicted nucleotidyltransferase